MKNRITHTRQDVIAHLAEAATVTYVFAGVIAATLAQGGRSTRLDHRPRAGRGRFRDVRDRGALSLEQAIVTAVLSAAAIALGVAIVNAVIAHQNQIR